MIGFIILSISCTTDKYVAPYNQDPTISISSHADGDSVNDGVSTTFEAIVGDLNHPVNQLNVRWLNKDGEICPNENPDDNGISICQYTPQQSDTWIRAQVIDPEGAFAEDQVDLNIVVNTPPSISLLSPQTNDQFVENEPISFQAIITDEEDESTFLEYRWTSNIDGTLSILSPPQSSGLIDGFAILTVGTHVITLSVTDTDGLMSSEVVAVVVEPANTSPNCEITSPQDQSLVLLGDTIEFLGSASDIETETTSLSVQWTSNIDGLLSNDAPDQVGQVSFQSVLSSGTHTITLLVDDNAGGSCSAVSTVHVDSPPTVAIQSPANNDNFDIGQNIIFTGTVSDAEETEDSLSIAWISSLDGVFSILNADATGSLSISTNTLSEGNHLITLQSADSMGLIGSDTIEITVSANTAPTATINSPIFGDVFGVGQSITFTGTVFDIEDAEDSLAVTWNSHLDGIFSNQSADANGNLSFTYSHLIEGLHTITLEVEDSMGLVGSDTLEIEIIASLCNPNPSGTVFIPSSAYCDPNPPIGWTQCAGWINTSGDDVSNSILDGCLNSNNRLRIRIWDQATNTLEEDVYSEDTDVSLWRSWDYLDGNITKAVSTYWTGNTTYFTTTGGGSACYFNTDCGIDAPCGTMTLGTGNGSSLILAPGWTNDYEVRVNCSGPPLNNKIVVVYH